MEYPQNIKDKLGRNYITRISDRKTMIRKFWGDTKKIKIIYNLIGDPNKPSEIYIDIFDKSDNIIASYSSYFGTEIKIDGFVGFGNTRQHIEFPILKEKLCEWQKKVKK